MSWTLDHVGTFGRSAQDTLAVLDVIAGPDPSDPLTLEQGPLGMWEELSFDGIQVGIPANWFFDHIDPEIEEIASRAIGELEKLGADVVQVEIPNTDRYFFVFSSVGRAEAAYAHSFLWDRKDEYLPGFREFLEDGRAIDVMRFIDASREREQIRGGLVSVLDRVDVLVSPTMPMEPPKYGQPEFRVGAHIEDAHNALMRVMYPYNLSGQPALSVPCGMTKDGLPAGLQMACQMGEDLKLLRLADTWLKAHPFEHPAL